MRLFLAKFLFTFDPELAPECADWLEGQKTFIMWEKPPLKMRLHLRGE
jgi:hypothetical protein